jgi:SAM-dependent methyltransferase
MTECSQNLFNAASESYGYRLSYHRTFFEELSKKLNLNRESKILDICCGHGQLSMGLADKIKKSVAIDNSSGMLSGAPQHPSVVYVNHDINSPPPLPPSLTNEKFDHFLIGRAIHWIKTDSLEHAIAKNLNNRGRIVICGAEWSSNTVWFRNFERARSSYRNGRHANFSDRDYLGVSKLAQIGFSVIDTLDIRYQVNCNLDFLLNHAMSYSSSAKEIESDLDNF